MTPKEIALALNSIDFIKIQADDQHENEKLKFLKYALINSPITIDQIINLLFDVIEVKDIKCSLGENYKTSPFNGMEEFNYLESNLNNYSEGSYITEEDFKTGKK